jgi:hypothetical protein
MFGWTLLDTLLGGDAEVLISVTDDELPADEQTEELESDAVSPDSA